MSSKTDKKHPKTFPQNSTHLEGTSGIPLVKDLHGICPKSLLVVRNCLKLAPWFPLASQPISVAPKNNSIWPTVRGKPPAWSHSSEQPTGSFCLPPPKKKVQLPKPTKPTDPRPNPPTQPPATCPPRRRLRCPQLQQPPLRGAPLLRRQTLPQQLREGHPSERRGPGAPDSEGHRATSSFCFRSPGFSFWGWPQDARQMTQPRQGPLNLLGGLSWNPGGG